MAITPAPGTQRRSRTEGQHAAHRPSTAGTGPRGGAEAYRSHAGRCDRRTEDFQPWRERLVAGLPARPGDTVLDAGCGTGLCLPMLHDKLGPTRTIVGNDASEQMLRVDAPADAARFCAVQDVLQSRAALGRVFEQLRPGAAVAAGGGKLPGPRLRHMRGWVRALHAPFGEGGHLVTRRMERRAVTGSGHDGVQRPIR